ncbi:MAG: diaminobutyrate acetyltransferase [Planctomycetota bacterium]|nr:MAG: diaminobutyrate acetyltransferase [Planctomycetota bacterium]
MAHIRLRAPTISDGPALHSLIAACPPLDVNSAYAYHLIGWHHSDTSIAAEDDEGLVGAVTAYRHPKHPQTLFVWQVAVHERGRGQGLAVRMMESLLARLPEITRLETTIGPSNRASHALFTRLADNFESQIHCEALIPAEACGLGHEAEDLVSVGPLAQRSPPRPS